MWLQDQSCRMGLSRSVIIYIDSSICGKLWIYNINMLIVNQFLDIYFKTFSKVDFRSWNEETFMARFYVVFWMRAIIEFLDTHYYLLTFGGFPSGAGGKEPTCQSRRLKKCGFDPWVENIPQVWNGSPLQYSFLQNPMDRGAWQATVHRAAKSQTWLKWISMHAYFLWCLWIPLLYLLPILGFPPCICTDLFTEFCDILLYWRYRFPAKQPHCSKAETLIGLEILTVLILFCLTI